MSAVTLVSLEGVEHLLSPEDASLSKIMKNHGSNVFYMNMREKLLEKLVTYLKKHKGEEPLEILAPVRHRQMSKNCEKWDAAFIDNLWLDNKMDLLDMSNIADIYEIDCLKDLCCAKIATLIKGKSFTRIIQIFQD